ncbi:MAG: diguanylate cyclase [Anaerolineales bacterium]|nr:diguanylate cyclase [Anaerolineales bacterium]
MNILVLEPNLKDRALIEKTLERGGHQAIFIDTSEQAWPPIQRGEIQFMIADWDTSDAHTLQFIPRLRAAKSFGHVYILLLTAKGGDEDLAPSGADDVLRKPLKPQELKTRISLGERMTAMANTLAEARDQLETMAVYDSLTGMLNRSAFYRQAQGELERARRTSHPFSIIALDIDNFKSLNEEHGPEIGDDVLRIVSQAIRENSRPYDCIGRWTGDEFVIALVGVIGSDAEKLTERIMTGICSIKITDKKDNHLNVKLSGGIAAASHIGTSAEMEPIIQQARQAMARAKEAGGNQICLSYV